MTSERVTAVSDDLKQRVARYYKRKHRVCYFELGLNRGGRLRADVFVLAMSGHIVVLETKSSVRDFLSDYKWELYKDYCNQFYLVFFREVYEKVKDKIPKGTGVFIFEQDARRKPKVISCRSQDLDSEVKHNLIIRAAFRNSDTTNRKNRRA